MDTLVRLNPEVLDDNEVGIIRAGTLLKLPVKASNIPENHRTDPRQQQSWDAIAEQRRREQAKEVVAAPYHRISDALAVRAIQENRYMVSAGHSISMIATQLLPYFPEYGSLTGLMNSLHQLNPDAFIDNDINRLRSNVPLRLPATIRP